MLRTLAGICTSAMPVMQNAHFPISRSWEPSVKVTFFRFSHSRNAYSLMVYTLAGICTSVMPVFQNALPPISLSCEPSAKVTLCRLPHS